MRSLDLPVPPPDLAARVGWTEGVDPVEFYLREGKDVHDLVVGCLPPDWSFPGRRVLDFGCGSGRVLRHFLDEEAEFELWGCDIDAASVRWVNANLTPPVRCVKNDMAPPLPFDDGRFDLVYATSVFTHIDRWSDWLLEMYRILAPEGLLVASFLGEGMWEAAIGEPYREDEVGMTVLRHTLDGGAGSQVFHSEWWLRAHWGRAFHVLGVTRPPRTPIGTPEITHSYITLRKRLGAPSAIELERCDPSEPRELLGLQTTVRLLRREIESVVADRWDLEDRRSVLLELARRSRPAQPLRRLRRRLRALGSPLRKQ